MFQAEGHDGSLFGSAISNNECHWKWCLADQRQKKKPENHHLHDYYQSLRTSSHHGKTDISVDSNIHGNVTEHNAQATKLMARR